MTTDGPGVFISYRRKDPGHAGRLHDRLVEHLGEARVFMDVDAIKPGEDWIEAISRALAKCGLMLVLIGDQWVQARIDSAARIGDNDDPVRLEIEAAFQQGIPIIPVLLPQSSIPSELHFLAEFGWVRFETDLDEPGPLERLRWGVSDPTDARGRPIPAGARSRS